MQNDLNKLKRLLDSIKCHLPAYELLYIVISGPFMTKRYGLIVEDRTVTYSC